MMLEPGGLYMQQQFQLDAAVFHQAEQGKKIVVPRDYPRNLKLIIGTVQWGFHSTAKVIKLIKL